MRMRVPLFRDTLYNYFGTCSLSVLYGGPKCVLLVSSNFVNFIDNQILLNILEAKPGLFIIISL